MTGFRKVPNSPPSTPPMHQLAVALLATLSAVFLCCCTRAVAPRTPAVAPAGVSASAPDDPCPGTNREVLDVLSRMDDAGRARPGEVRQPDTPHHPHFGAPYRVEAGSRTVFSDGSVHTKLRLRAERLPPPLIRLSVRSGTTARVTGASLTGPDGVRRTPRLPPSVSDAVTVIFDEVPSGDVTITVLWSGDPGRYSIDLDTSGE